MKKALLWTLVLPLFVLAGLSCDSANPVAPSGTTLTITASPTQISLNGTSIITVVGRRPNGDPLSAGTEIRFSTSLGTIDAIVQTDGNGVARATLRADGRSGTATVSATTGGGTLGGGGGDGEEGGGGTTTGASVSIEVLIGESEETRPTLLVSASPDNIPVEGTSEITIIGRNSDGTAVEAGLDVILTSTLGSLDPSRPVTGPDGTATSVLTAGTQSGTATITAILGASEPATTQVTIRQAATDISIQANPSSIGSGGETIELTAFVTNAQGEPNQGSAVTFESQRGSLGTTGVIITGSQGVAENTLTLTQNDLINVTSFKVFARTPDGTGTLIEAETTIQVVQNQ
jgi:hypothetical protein